MANVSFSEISGDYAEKMNSVLTDAFNNWWNSLTKEELLDWMMGQQSITADTIRDLFKNECCNLKIGAHFSLEQGRAVADFGDAQI